MISQFAYWKWLPVVQTIPSRFPSLVLPSISSLCTLCIPQSEYHLQYFSLWSDPVHVLSLTHSQLAHLWPFSSSTTSMSLSTSSHLQQGPTHVTDTGRCPHSGSYISAIPDWVHPLLLRLAWSCSLCFGFPMQRCAQPPNSWCTVVKISLTSEPSLFRPDWWGEPVVTLCAKA